MGLIVGYLTVSLKPLLEFGSIRSEELEPSYCN